MSTRSRIGLVRKDGTILSIYCHNDGYLDAPHGVGFKLYKHYQDTKKIEALLELGDISELDEHIAPPPGVTHRFDGPKVEGVVVAYGQKGTKAQISKTVEDFEKLHEEYNYLFKDGKWFVTPEGEGEQELTFASPL